MIKNYLLIAFKNLKKQKRYALINILGLTVGITCCLMIFLYITNELSYDNFHKKGKDIYRVMRNGIDDGNYVEIPYLSAPYATALKNDYPDAILQTVRVMMDNDLVTYNNISFNEKKIALVDSNFFDLFDFALIKGDKHSVFRDPASIVMSESSAKKYFGNQDPIGKVVSFNKDLQLKVTGVMQDVPVNSHLKFDILVPLGNWRATGWFNQWPNNGLFVYVQLNPAVDPAQLKNRFPQFMDKYMGKFYAKSGFKMGLTIKPLKEIYFETASPFDNVRHGNKKMVYIFMSIAILILVIACINFVNLTTARVTDRSKEVGLRKVMGALRKQLIGQFILESVLFATVSCILAVALLQLLMPAYTRLLGYQLPAYWSNPWLYVFLFGVIISVGLLAGSYPAFLLSSFSPIESLKGKLRIGKDGAFFRQALVVFQFGVSVLLIISITVILMQMQFVKNSDLGFSRDQSVIVRLDNNDIWEKKIEFKNELKQIPAVQEVSLMSGEPGGFHDMYAFTTEARPNVKIPMHTEFADFQFAKTLDLKIIAGRDFSPQFKTDSDMAVLVNRNAATLMGYTPEQAIGKWIKNLSNDSLNRKIIGVLEDYHYSSLKDPIGPLVVSTSTDRRLALIKLNTNNNIRSTVNAIRKAYTAAAPSYPFEYEFLDDRYNLLYQSEMNQETILSIFSAIGIFIACLGLFGLASYTAIKRTKEIGIRKVLGSSVSNIVILLSKDLLKPVLIGTLIALPPGYYFMNQWLQGFAYRISIQAWMFMLAALLAILIAVITVSLQAIKAALSNPIRSLRSE